MLIFYVLSPFSLRINFSLYVDDIVVTISDKDVIKKLKQYLAKKI